MSAVTVPTAGAVRESTTTRLGLRLTAPFGAGCEDHVAVGTARPEDACEVCFRASDQVPRARSRSRPDDGERLERHRFRAAASGPCMADASSAPAKATSRGTASSTR